MDTENQDTHCRHTASANHLFSQNVLETNLEFDKLGVTDRFKRKIRATIKIVELCNTTRVFKFVVISAIATFLLLDLYLCYFITSMPRGTTLPFSTNTTEDPCFASPFCHINVKGLLMDPPDFYIHVPTGSFFIQKLNFASCYQFITPNFISVAHVPVAFIASALITQDTLFHRRAGVLVYQLRNFLDGVDGLLARARSQAKINQPQISTIFLNSTAGTKIMSTMSTNTPEEIPIGYWIDGICDFLGSIFLFAACFLYLQKHPFRRWNQFSYNLLPVVITSRNGSSTANSPTNQCAKEKSKTCSIKGNTNAIQCGPYLPKSYLRQSTRHVTAFFYHSGIMSVQFGFQVLFGAIAWNRYIPAYKKLLEPLTNHKFSESYTFAANLLHSPVMWIVIIIWRYANPHAWVEILLLSIFFDRMGELLHLFRNLGFLAIGLATILTEAHLYFVQDTL